MNLQNIKDKINKEFSALASAYAEFHEAILDLFNKVILNNLNSEAVKYSYLKVVETNIKLLKLNKGFEDEFFKGKISKKLIEQFFDRFISSYNSYINSDDILITSEEKEIYQVMVDNYNLIIRENKEFQDKDKGFKKYKINYKRDAKENIYGSYPIVTVEGLEKIEEKNDL